MKTICAEQFGPIEQLRIQHVMEQEPGPGAVRVRVRAASIGFVDALKVQGLYQTKDPVPFVPGMEYAGLVEAAGDGVSQTMVGARVFGIAARGALAEQIVVSESSLMRMPDHISFSHAAAVPLNYMTALYALKHRADLQAGEALLVLGAAGGTGAAAIKVGKMLGAYVVAAASTEEKRSFALNAGADAAVDYTRDDWRATLKELTGQRVMDAVYDSVGGEASTLAFRTLGWRGRYLVIGFAAGKIPALPLNIALLKGASLIGIDSAQIQKWEPNSYTGLLSDIERGLEGKSLEPPPIQTFAFADFQAAFSAILGRRALGKVVIEIGH